MLYTCTKYSYMCMLTVHILAEWDSDCAGECLSFCQQEWRDFFLQTIFVSYHTCACTCVQSLFNSVAFQTSTRATAVQLQLFCLVSHACDDGYTITLLVMHVSFSVAEEDMRLMLVSSSPLTTSVNAITWQDYIGTYIHHHIIDTRSNTRLIANGFDDHYLLLYTWGGYLVGGGVLATKGSLPIRVMQCSPQHA